MGLRLTHWSTLAVVSFAVLACQSAPVSQPEQAPTSAPQVATPATTALSPTNATAAPASRAVAASPSPAATAIQAPGGTRGAPAGKAVFAVPYSISATFLDPQEYPTVITPFSLGYLLHDALVKHMPGQPYAPSLAQAYEIAPDYKSATFHLRAGIKFHNGDPVTADDVKFSFEQYRGGGAKTLHDRTERVEVVDPQTVRFVFKQPFLDFLMLYGSAATAAGWIVPAKYYQQVGPDGFKKAPVGAGPYKFVSFSGDTLTTEANADYWRKAPPIKTMVVRQIPDDTTRLAAVKTGEADLAQQFGGLLIDTIRQDPQITIAPVQGISTYVLEFPGFERPDNIFNDVRIRRAISLALDRQALSDAEVGGLAAPAGNWIAAGLPGAIHVPAPAQDLARAKQLLAEAGYPNGFDAENYTPTTLFASSLGERVLTQLLAVGIRAKLTRLDTAASFALLLQNQTPNHARGIWQESPGAAGDAANQIAASATCAGGRSPKCLPEIEEKFKQYQASTDPQERQRLVEEMQRYLLDQQVLVPIYHIVTVNAQGQRIANDPKEIWGAIPQFSLLGPYEDIRLK